MKKKERIKQLEQEVKSLKIELAKERGLVYFDKGYLKEVQLNNCRHTYEIQIKPVYFDPFKAMLPSTFRPCNCVMFK